MTTKKLLREAIRHMLFEDKLGDALGKVVFSPNRTDDVPRNEPNTKTEEDLFRELRLWILDYRPISLDGAALLTAALDDPRYYDYIHRAVPEDVYRGMFVSRKTFARWMNFDPETMPDKGQSDSSYVLRPHSYLGAVKPLSFSRNSETARSFAETAKMDRPASAHAGMLYVLWQADTALGGNEFIDIESMQSKTSNMSPGSEESEVISFKPVRTTNVWWWTEETA